MKRMFLGAILCAVVVSLSGTRAAAQPAAKVIAVTARRFEFVPSELKIRKGEAVTLRVTSQDVTHGFFNRKLKIDTELPAGRPVDVTLVPDQPGKFLVICDHFCGALHGNMHLSVEVEEK